MEVDAVVDYIIIIFILFIVFCFLLFPFSEKKIEVEKNIFAELDELKNS